MNVCNEHISQYRIILQLIIELNSQNLDLHYLDPQSISYVNCIIDWKLK